MLIVNNISMAELNSDHIRAPHQAAASTSHPSRLVFGGRIDTNKLDREKESIRAKLPTLRSLKFETASYFAKDEVLQDFFTIFAGKLLPSEQAADSSLSESGKSFQIIPPSDILSPSPLSRSQLSFTNVQPCEGCQLTELYIYNLVHLSDAQFSEMLQGLQALDFSRLELFDYGSFTPQYRSSAITMFIAHHAPFLKRFHISENFIDCWLPDYLSALKEVIMNGIVQINFRNCSTSRADTFSHLLLNICHKTSLRKLDGLVLKQCLPSQYLVEQGAIQNVDTKLNNEELMSQACLLSSSEFTYRPVTFWGDMYFTNRDTYNQALKAAKQISLKYKGHITDISNKERVKTTTLISNRSRQPEIPLESGSSLVNGGPPLEEVELLSSCFDGREVELTWSQHRADLFWLYEVVDVLIKRKTEWTNYRPVVKVWMTDGPINGCFYYAELIERYGSLVWIRYLSEKDYWVLVEQQNQIAKQVVESNPLRHGELRVNYLMEDANVEDRDIDYISDAALLSPTPRHCATAGSTTPQQTDNEGASPSTVDVNAEQNMIKDSSSPLSQTSLSNMPLPTLSLPTEIGVSTSRRFLPKRSKHQELRRNRTSAAPTGRVRTRPRIASSGTAGIASMYGEGPTVSAVDLVFIGRVEPVGVTGLRTVVGHDSNVIKKERREKELQLGTWVEFQLPYDPDLTRPNSRIRRTVIGYIGDENTDISGIVSLPVVSTIDETSPIKSDSGGKIPRLTPRHQRSNNKNLTNPFSSNQTVVYTVICPFSFSSDHLVTSSPSTAASRERSPTRESYTPPTKRIPSTQHSLDPTINSSIRRGRPPQIIERANTGTEPLPLAFRVNSSQLTVYTTLSPPSYWTIEELLIRHYQTRQQLIQSHQSLSSSIAAILSGQSRRSSDLAQSALDAEELVAVSPDPLAVDELPVTPRSIHIFPRYYGVDLSDLCDFGGVRFTPVPIESDQLRYSLADMKILPMLDPSLSQVEFVRSSHLSSPDADEYLSVARLISQLKNMSQIEHPRQRLGGLGNRKRDCNQPTEAIGLIQQQFVCLIDPVAWTLINEKASKTYGSPRRSPVHSRLQTLASAVLSYNRKVTGKGAPTKIACKASSAKPRPKGQKAEVEKKQLSISNEAIKSKTEDFDEEPIIELSVYDSKNSIYEVSEEQQKPNDSSEGIKTRSKGRSRKLRKTSIVSERSLDNIQIKMENEEKRDAEGLALAIVREGPPAVTTTTAEPFGDSLSGSPDGDLVNPDDVSLLGLHIPQDQLQKLFYPIDSSIETEIHRRSTRRRFITKGELLLDKNSKLRMKSRRKEMENNDSVMSVTETDDSSFSSCDQSDEDQIYTCLQRRRKYADLKTQSAFETMEGRRQPKRSIWSIDDDSASAMIDLKLKAETKIETPDFDHVDQRFWSREADEIVRRLWLNSHCDDPKACRIDKIIATVTRPPHIKYFDRETRRRRAMEIMRDKEFAFWNLLESIKFRDDLCDELLHATPEKLVNMAEHISETFFEKCAQLNSGHGSCCSSYHDEFPQSIWEGVCEPWIQDEVATDRAGLVLLLAELAGILPTTTEANQEGGEKLTKVPENQLKNVDDETMIQLLDFIADCRELKSRSTKRIEALRQIPSSISDEMNSTKRISKETIEEDAMVIDGRGDNEFARQANRLCFIDPTFETAKADARRLAPQSVHMIAARVAQAAGIPAPNSSETLLREWSLSLGTNKEKIDETPRDKSQPVDDGKNALKSAGEQGDTEEPKVGRYRRNPPDSSMVVRHLTRIGAQYGIPPEAIARSLDKNLTKLSRTFGRRLAALYSSVDRDPDTRQLSDLYIRRKLGQETKLYKSILSSWKAHDEKQKASQFVDGTLVEPAIAHAVAGGRSTRKKPVPPPATSKNRNRNQTDVGERRSARGNGELVHHVGYLTQDRTGVGGIQSRSRKAKLSPYIGTQQPTVPTKMQTRYASFNPTPGTRPEAQSRMTEEETSMSDLSDNPPLKQQQRGVAKSESHMSRKRSAPGANDSAVLHLSSTDILGHSGNGEDGMPPLTKRTRTLNQRDVRLPEGRLSSVREADMIVLDSPELGASTKTPTGDRARTVNLERPAANSGSLPFNLQSLSHLPPQQQAKLLAALVTARGRPPDDPQELVKALALLCQQKRQQAAAAAIESGSDSQHAYQLLQQRLRSSLGSGSSSSALTSQQAYMAPTPVSQDVNSSLMDRLQSILVASAKMSGAPGVANIGSNQASLHPQPAMQRPFETPVDPQRILSLLQQQRLQQQVQAQQQMQQHGRSTQLPSVLPQPMQQQVIRPDFDPVLIETLLRRRMPEANIAQVLSQLTGKSPQYVLQRAHQVITSHLSGKTNNTPDPIPLDNGITSSSISRPPILPSSSTTLDSHSGNIEPDHPDSSIREGISQDPTNSSGVRRADTIRGGNEPDGATFK